MTNIELTEDAIQLAGLQEENEHLQTRCQVYAHRTASLRAALNQITEQFSHLSSELEAVKVELQQLRPEDEEAPEVPDDGEAPEDGDTAWLPEEVATAQAEVSGSED